MLNIHEDLVELIAFFGKGRPVRHAGTIQDANAPKWFVVHMLINANAPIPLPHESAGWSIDE